MTKADDKGTPVTKVDAGVRSLGREAITVGHEDIPVRFYRVSDPPIFAGFRINWLEGRDETTGAEIDLSSGAGMGSKYMTLSIEIPGRGTVYEYVDMAEVLENRVAAILAEVTG